MPPKKNNSTCSFGKLLGDHACGENPLFHISGGKSAQSHTLTTLSECQDNVYAYLDNLQSLSEDNRHENEGLNSTENPSEIDLILNRTGQDKVTINNVAELNICPLHRLNLTTGFMVSSQCQHPLHEKVCTEVTMKHLVDVLFQRVDWRLSNQIYETFEICVPIGQGVCWMCTYKHYEARNEAVPEGIATAMPTPGNLRTWGNINYGRKKQTRVQANEKKAQLKRLEFKNPGKFMENFDPERSSREMRKVNRRIYCEKLKRNQVYGETGKLLENSMDLCDCLEKSCAGCHFPCPKCGSQKCGNDCRINRRWIYQEIETEITGSKLFFPVNISNFG